MQYEEMQQKLHQYNWDDGFDLPWKIISDKNCDLAIALEVFYLADGFGYFQTFIHNVGGTKEWFCFMATLYEKIVNGTYPKTNHTYQIPLSKVQRMRMAKYHIPSIFLNDIT